MDFFSLLALFTHLALALLDLAIVLRYSLWATRVLPRWADFLPALALALLVAAIATGTMTVPLFMIVILSLPLYLVTLGLFLATVGRLFRRGRPAPAARWRLPKALAALACAALVLLSATRVVELASYTAAIFPNMEALLHGPGDADLSERSWSEAFAGARDKLKAEYPFTEWKRIDWDKLYAEFAPRIADAEARHDSKAYYRALREFAWRIPDTHVGLGGDDQGLAEAEVGGSYGLKLIQLDDGRLVVGGLDADSSAARAGIQIGAEIVAWNHTPAAQALAQTSIIWSEYPAGTAEGAHLQRARFLSRGPVGSTAEVAFRNRGEPAPHTATLTATPAEIAETSGPGFPDLVRTPVHSQRLASGYGYIRIDHELPAPLGFPDAEVRQAVAQFAAENVPGIIVDVRNNYGGESGLTAGILSAFQPQERVFQYLGLLDPASQRFRPVSSPPLMITPAQTQYHGRVAVLIDNYSHSAAENIALVLQDLPNGIAVGTSGSASGGGGSETDIRLPGGYTLGFPKYQSLDGNFGIQIESDYTGAGGVTPDVRVPLDDATIDALGAGRDVVLERAEAALRDLAASGN